MQVLAYFKPLHKAVRYYCNLCGVSIGEDEYQTAVARRMEAAEREGHFVFCKECSPSVDSVINELCAAENQLDAEFAKDKQARLAEKALELLGKLKPSNGGQPVPNPASDALVSPPTASRRAGSPSTRIPGPRSN